MKKWMTTAIVLIILLAGSLYAYKYYEGYKQTQEFLIFRETVLDEVYYPILRESEGYFKEIESGKMSYYDPWYTLEGFEKNKKLSTDLLNARKTIVDVNLKYRDATELREVVLHNIQIHQGILQEIDSYGEKVEPYDSNEFYDRFNSGLNELSDGIGKLSDHYQKYY
ncbi:hypothetical protein ACQ4XT_08585 [Halobacillus faecis]